MENRIKIVFFDIDGTLIDTKKKQISIRTLEMLKKLKKRGIVLCIATGRAPLELPSFGTVEFDAFLTFNGSYCYNRYETIFSNPLRTDDVYTIIENAAAIQRPLLLATKDRLAANGSDEDLREYLGFAGLDVEIADDFNAVAAEEVYQIMLGCREKDHSRLLQNVCHAKIASWWDRAVGIIPADGGKGAGIAKILEYFHLHKSDAMAFGDGNNDIEMLRAVGRGIAMGNASDLLKEAAFDICGNVSDDGIYDYCIKNHLL